MFDINFLLLIKLDLHFIWYKYDNVIGLFKMVGGQADRLWEPFIGDMYKIEVWVIYSVEGDKIEG